jgi:hypothetical protein
VWNEPNFAQFWSPQTDAAARYADLYAASRSAIRAIDPEAQVVVGGLVDWNAQTFVREMYRHRPSLRGNVDAIGYHPYHYDFVDVHASVAELRATLRDLRDGSVPIELTEVGWDGSMASEAHRANGLARLAREVRGWGLGVTRLIPFCWQSNDWGDDRFGIYNADGSPKPSGAAYAQAVQDMSAPPVSSPGHTMMGSTPARPIASSGASFSAAKLRMRMERPARWRHRARGKRRRPIHHRSARHSAAT